MHVGDNMGNLIQSAGVKPSNQLVLLVLAGWLVKAGQSSGELHTGAIKIRIQSNVSQIRFKC